jgi:hypothetical protein
MVRRKAPMIATPVAAQAHVEITFRPDQVISGERVPR